ncbi:DsbA family protein [Govanella unica]|uniref:DsbA family protein n=1 Tax=Govanella unica TaxID=2975056 RepID=A0A9X3TX40_9PROT|nr:DsbA family protein [Govania unica]MDA5193376.1 DsbA family protein [Govania unica]
MINHLNKRFMAVAALVVGLGFGLGFGPVMAAGQAPAAKAPAAAAPAKPAAEVYDGYTDIVLGKKTAPITVIEYASMTCSHCADFQRTVFPQFKKDYIDTGKAKYIMRHFVLNGPDLIASMIARCSPEPRYYAFVDGLLTRQADWMPGWETMPQPAENATPYEIAKAAKMDQFVRPMGFTDAKLKSCLASDKVRTDLLKLRQEGVSEYKIQGTPTILINGKVFDGDHTFSAFDKALKAAK